MRVAISMLFVALASFAWAELDAVDEVHGESDLAISYQCVKDFNECARGIPELAAHSEGMYRTEYAGCCAALSHGRAYAKEEVPETCEVDAEGNMECEPARTLHLDSFYDLRCGDDWETKADARRVDVMNAITARDDPELVAWVDYQRFKSEFADQSEEAE
ncbi:MAG: hypothetical protein OXQ84_12875 [bacterium]|nr:hypothetical protein [bacterium]